MNKGIKTSLLAMITVLSIALLMPAAMAYDHDQTYDANSTFFVQEDVRSLDSSDRTVEVWINTSVDAGSGKIVFNYDPNCANVISATLDSSNWASGGVNTGTPGQVIATFGTTSAQSGEQKVLNI